MFRDGISGIRRIAAAPGFATAPEPFRTALFYDFNCKHEQP
jgi:hypothetical protein